MASIVKKAERPIEIKFRDPNRFMESLKETSPSSMHSSTRIGDAILIVDKLKVS